VFQNIYLQTCYTRCSEKRTTKKAMIFNKNYVGLRSISCLSNRIFVKFIQRDASNIKYRLIVGNFVAT